MKCSKSSCPCTFEEVEACKDQCTCRNPLHSGGCDRCCSYGNNEQRVEQAKRLAQIDKACKEFGLEVVCEDGPDRMGNKCLWLAVKANGIKLCEMKKFENEIKEY